MREIKFRYWCTFECEMYQKAYLEEHMDLAFMSELLEAAQKRYVFMQYTGLKDKNGKEIYERDIIKTSWYNEPFFVRWDAPEFLLENDAGEMVDFNNFERDDLEIVGNIYENPDIYK